MKPSQHCVIGVAGRHQVGKDTFASSLSAHLKIHGARYPIITFGAADGLKDEIARCFGVDRAAIERIKLTTLGRKILEYVGTCVLTRGEFLDYIANTISEIKTPHIFMVTGIRHCDEAHVIKQFGGYMIMVRRDTGNAHQLSEKEIDEIVPDFLFDNNGSFLDLNVVAESLADQLICSYHLNQ